VNIASRMETNGTPGEIQITRATYDLVKDEFVCRSRGTIPVKGKGEMETWYLVGPRSTNGGAADRGRAVASEASMPGGPID
jgi:guanylate cyclase